VPNLDEPIRILPDGSGVDSAGMTYVINPFDAIALEEALRIRDRQGVDCSAVAVGLGNADYEAELRTALAMGADRAVRVDCDAFLDPSSAAQLLAAVVRREQPDLVLMGKQAVDDDANQTGQMLAGLLDWPQATFVSKIEIQNESTARVCRETDLGLETIVVPLPAIITTDLRLNAPRYASLPALLKAKKRAIELVGIEQLGVVVAPKLRIHWLEPWAVERRCVRVATVEDLVHRLRYEAKVI
jgi:electron transfer flavoprotein beta subunit